jgi:hypothetical protein
MEHETKTPMNTNSTKRLGHLQAGKYYKERNLVPIVGMFPKARGKVSDKGISFISCLLRRSIRENFWRSICSSRVVPWRSYTRVPTCFKKDPGYRHDVLISGCKQQGWTVPQRKQEISENKAGFSIDSFINAELTLITQRFF